LSIIDYGWKKRQRPYITNYKNTPSSFTPLEIYPVGLPYGIGNVLGASCFLMVLAPLRSFSMSYSILKLSAASHVESSILEEQYNLVFARLPPSRQWRDYGECARYRFFIPLAIYPVGLPYGIGYDYYITSMIYHPRCLLKHIYSA